MGTLELVYKAPAGTLYPLAEQQVADCDKSDSEYNNRWLHFACDKHVIGADVCSDDSYTYTAWETAACTAGGYTASEVWSKHKAIVSSTAARQSVSPQQASFNACENMLSMFNGASLSNQFIDSWDVSSVTGTSGMFNGTQIGVCSAHRDPCVDVGT